MLLKFEIKKILKKRYLLVLFIIGTLLLCCMTFANSTLRSESAFQTDSSSEWNKIQLEAGKSLENKKLDQNFLDNMRNDINEYIKQNSVNFPSEAKSNMYVYAAEKLGYIDVFNLINHVTGDVNITMSISESEYYDLVQSKMQTLYQPNEVEYWTHQYDSVQKPYVYSYAKGYANFSELIYFYMWFLFILITVTVSGIFADETLYKTNAVVYSTKKCRSTLIASKICAGIILACAETIFVLLLNLLISLCAFGVIGAGASVQSLIYCAYNLTIGGFVGYCIICAVVIGILFACFSMLVSSFTKSSMSVLIVQVGVFVISLFSFPRSLGILSDLWLLRPTHFLMYSTFSMNTTVYNLFGIQLNCLQAALIFYLILICICIIALVFYQRKSYIRFR